MPRFDQPSFNLEEFGVLSRFHVIFSSTVVSFLARVTDLLFMSLMDRRTTVARMTHRKGPVANASFQAIAIAIP